MIFVSYPVGTGGNFVASVLALLINNHHNQILNDGSMHSRRTKGYQRFIFSDNNVEFEQKITLDNISCLSNPDYLHESIFTVHMSDLKKIIELLPCVHVVYITITDPKWIAIQQINFLKKVINRSWSEKMYQGFAGTFWPKFDKNLSNMPQWVIDDMMNINLKYINSWKFVLPEDQSQCLEIPMELTVKPSLLLDRVVNFFNLTPSEERYQQAVDLVNDYIKINNYD